MVSTASRGGLLYAALALLVLAAALSTSAEASVGGGGARRVSGNSTTKAGSKHQELGAPQMRNASRPDVNRSRHQAVAGINHGKGGYNPLQHSRRLAGTHGASNGGRGGSQRPEGRSFMLDVNGTRGGVNHTHAFNGTRGGNNHTHAFNGTKHNHTHAFNGTHGGANHMHTFNGTRGGANNTRPAGGKPFPLVANSSLPLGRPSHHRSRPDNLTLPDGFNSTAGFMRHHGRPLNGSDATALMGVANGSADSRPMFGPGNMPLPGGNFGGAMVAADGARAGGGGGGGRQQQSRGAARQPGGGRMGLRYLAGVHGGGASGDGAAQRPAGNGRGGIHQQGSAATNHTRVLNATRGAHHTHARTATLDTNRSRGRQRRG